MNALLKDGLDVQVVLLKIEYLAKVHHDALVDLLPKMGSEYLDQ